MKQKKGKPFFIDEAIDEVVSKKSVIQNQPIEQDGSLPPRLRDIQYRKNTIRYLEFWGRVPKEDAREFEEQLKSKNISVPIYGLFII